MVEAVLLVAVALMAAGALGAVVPAVPSGLLSLAGVYGYVLFGARPVGPVLLGVLTATGLLAVLVDWFAGPLTAKAGGASTRTVLAAAVAGVALLFVAGPVGLVVGVVGVVLVVELAGGADPGTAGRRAVYAAAGVLASAAVQFLLAAAVLAAFVAGVVL